MIEPPSWQALVDEVRRLWEGIRDSLPGDLWSRQTATDLVRLTRPVKPFNSFDLVTPVIGLAGVLVGLLLAGVALGALGTLLASLLALGLLLTEVFGVTLEVGGLPPHE